MVNGLLLGSGCDYPNLTDSRCSRVCEKPVGAWRVGQSIGGQLVHHPVCWGTVSQTIRRGSDETVARIQSVSQLVTIFRQTTHDFLSDATSFRQSDD